MALPVDECLPRFGISDRLVRPEDVPPSCLIAWSDSASNRASLRSPDYGNLLTSLGHLAFREVSELRRERRLEGGPLLATRFPGDEVGIGPEQIRAIQETNDRCHHQIARREAVAIEVGFVAQRI